MQSDLRTAVSRAILSVPGHFFFAVCMGLFLSRAKQAENCGQLRRSRWLQAAAVLAPMALHGAKGEILFQKRTSPFESPKRKAGGVSTLPPAPPNDQKGGAQPLLFGLSTPCF